MQVSPNHSHLQDGLKTQPTIPIQKNIEHTLHSETCKAHHRKNILQHNPMTQWVFDHKKNNKSKLINMAKASKRDGKINSNAKEQNSKANKVD